MARTALLPVEAQPFLKWAGGKKQLLPQFASLYPERVERYIEPFAGSAAVFFDIRRRRELRSAALSDSNAELIDCYRAVQDHVDELIEFLAEHKQEHSDRYYYRMRRDPPTGLVERAARLIYLNKTCYNGLYRVNSKGEFNVPIGRYKNPAIYRPDVLRTASAALQGVDLQVRDFRDWLPKARRGDFFYIDPPYFPLSSTANFTSYTEGGFGPEEQARLAEFVRRLDEKGCLVMVSNSDTPEVRKLYRGLGIKAIINAEGIKTVQARRAINSNGASRGAITELVIRNYTKRGR